MDAAEEKGMSIFLDVFRRADKNDDNALSWGEFRSFFADGVLSESELKDLFNEIDTHNTNNIDTGELCSYFSSHMGPFKAIFSSLESLTAAVNEALKTSAKEYTAGSTVQQFITRFLMRETLQQMSATQRPLEGASDTLDSQAIAQSMEDGAERADGAAEVQVRSTATDVNEDNIDTLAASGANIVPGRLARRARRQISSQTSWGLVDSGADMGGLTQQIERLRCLVDKMENKVNLDGAVEEDFVDFTDEQLLLIVQRKMLAQEGEIKAFRNSLKTYVEQTNKAPGCLHVHVRGYSGTNSFSVYEIWDSEEEWKQYSSSETSRSFRHKCVDVLDAPETTATLKIPGSWWSRE